MANITENTNIDILEKLSDGNYKIKFPKTTMEQVQGLSTAQEVLDVIKTVDGAGSGLDADTLNGNKDTAFLKQYSTTLGNMLIRETMPQDITIEKRIPIGVGKTQGVVTIENTKKALFVVNTGMVYVIRTGEINNLETISLQPISLGGEYAGTGFGVSDVYIDGSDLVVKIRREWNGEVSMSSCRVYWRVS